MLLAIKALLAAYTVATVNAPEDALLRLFTDLPPPYEYYEVTAFTANYESTGKHRGQRGYGVTASGEKVRERHTLACPRSIPFGSTVYIPYVDRTYTCEDRGAAITDGHLDVYMRKVSDAKAFGRRKLPVKITLKETME